MEKQELFNCSYDRAFGKIKKYWDKNGFLFPNYYQKYFKSNIYEMIEQNDIDKIDEITRSILSYLGILNFYHDIESQFLSFFEQYFGREEFYKTNIIGVSQNYLPALIKKIADESEKYDKDKLIKVVGPNIILGIDDSINFEISRKAFAANDIGDEEMIISYAPREISERVFMTAIHTKKELLMNFDGYIPDRDAFFLPSKSGYLGELYEYGVAHKDPNFDIDIVDYSSTGHSALVLKKK